MYRFSTRTLVYLALMAAVACGDNQAEPDAAPTPDGAPIPDAAEVTPDATPDAAPIPDGLPEVVAAADGAVDLPVVQVWVTYTKVAVGNDVAGFFVQAMQTGPAVFVAVDPATLDPIPAVGDRVSFTVNEVDTDAGLRRITMLADWAVDSTGGDVSVLEQDLTAAADLVTELDNYNSELVTVTATFTNGFGFAGTDHMKADVDTGALIGDPDVALRMPTVLSDAIELTYDPIVGCTAVTTLTPLWRFNGEAQFHVWDAAELNVTCPAPTVASALATSDTEVIVQFSRPLDAASVMANGSQFTVDNNLTVSAAAVNGNSVTLTTSAQTQGTTYTVTVADTVTDVPGTGVDQNANTATFDGYTPPPPPTFVINEVDYDIDGAEDFEFVEIYNYGANDLSLANVALVLINGNGDVEYSRTDLSGEGTLAAGGYLVVGDAGVTVPGGVPLVLIDGGSVQNGPDGIALVNTLTEEVYDVLSYEGAGITAAQITGFGNTVNLVEGNVATAVDVNTGVASMARLPNGSDTNDADTDWAQTMTVTPGAANQ